MAKNVKERALKRKEERDLRPRATANYVRMGSTKVARILNEIRGKSYVEAIGILENTPHSATRVVRKVVESAASNGEVKGLSKADMFVAECYANQGPILKRMMPRAKGRGDRILKPTTHITVVMDTNK